MIHAQPKIVMTPEEYPVMERHSERKSEYLDGEVFAMAGAGRKHNIIMTNVVRILGNTLVDQLCIMYSSEMKVKIEKIFRQSDNTWIYSGFHDMKDTILIQMIHCELSLQDIYGKIKFIESET